MTEYMLAPKGNFAAEPNLVGMFENGKLSAYRVRANGTLRPLQLLPIASTVRETAEWIYDQYEDGRTVQAIGRELHVSAPTVRRFLESLELTEQIEAGEWDEFWADTHGFAAPQDPTDEPEGTEETACAQDAEEYADQLAASVSAVEKAAGADAGVFFS